VSRLSESVAGDETAGVLPLLRRAATILRAAPDRAALASSLNEFMQLVPALQAAWVDLGERDAAEPGLSAGRFSPEALTLPLQAGDAMVGVFRRRLHGPPMTAAQLRLLGAVADLLGAIVGVTTAATATRQARALLALVLEHVPFGAACFSGRGDVIAANAAAREFAAGMDSLAAVLLPREVPGRGPGGREPLLQVVRSGERSALVHVHAGTADADAGGLVALVFDLGRQSREFLDALARETYRALWLGQPLALAVISAPSDPVGVHRIAGAIRQQLGVTAATGPLEADTVAVMAPGQNLTGLRLIVRHTAGFEAIPDLQLGVAELEPSHRTPENFITAAVGSLAPVARLRRPTLLLCDTSPSVTEALHVALRADCDAVQCHDRDLGWRLLGERTFDAIFAKIELDEWDRDLGFLQRALELQPGMRPFVVTDAPGLYSATLPSLPPGTPVFRKPFQVAAVRHAVREQLARASAA
jgi:hypothetical protein